jgi:hypothetical protein
VAQAPEQSYHIEPIYLFEQVAREVIIATLYVAKFWARGADRLTVTLTKREAE